MGAEQFQGIFHAVGGNSSPSSDKEWRTIPTVVVFVCVKGGHFPNPSQYSGEESFFVKVKVTLES